MKTVGRESLIILMVAYALGYFVLMRLPWDILRSGIAGSDLSSYYTAGHLVMTGRSESLYEVGEGDTILGDATSGAYRQAGDELGITRQHYYIYPPFFALMAAPLSLIPFNAVRYLWLGSDLLLLGLFVWLFTRWRRRDGTGLTMLEGGLIVITLGLEFLPLIWTLAIGQTSIMLLVLLAGTMLAVKTGNEGWGGVFLGIATAIKLTPALLIVYFALRGRPRTAVVAISCFVACNLLAVVLVGGGVTWEFYAEIVPMMSGGTSYFLNQSLAGLFDRWLGAGDVRQVALESSIMARLLSIATGLVLLAVTGLAMRNRNGWSKREKPEGLGLDLEVSLILLLTLVLSPISWSHHYVLALIPLYTAVAAAIRSGRVSLSLALGLGVAFLLIARKPHFDLFLHGPSRLALSATLGGALLIWSACLLLLRWGPGGSGEVRTDGASEVVRAI